MERREVVVQPKCFWGLKTGDCAIQWVENAFVFSKQRCWHKELCSSSLNVRRGGALMSRTEKRGMARRINKLATLYRDVLRTAGNRELWENSRCIVVGSEAH
jgi:hypothetical protein